ncbi:hypothetical protein [Phaeobacter sp. B1627]|uniref:hypothetical protein n=1 Tax=Phaeobacter sp. B1627 TaxID=2583809 RepID=UPI001118C6D0|nr:hypothetical protein [Phaeobacter sp. B1627]TNJ46801.1 hypothetical protein FGE21_05100 [Phaeobacter sp. B1627]
MVNEALHRSGTNPIVRCGMIAGLLASAPAFVRAEDWSGRFLGAWSRDSTMAAPRTEVFPDPGEIGARALNDMPPIDLFDLEQGLAGMEEQTTGAGHVGGGFGSGPRFYMLDGSAGTVLHGADDPAMPGVGMEVQLSSQVTLRGSLSSGDNGEGRPSLAPEYRQLGVTAAFRF